MVETEIGAAGRGETEREPFEETNKRRATEGDLPSEEGVGWRPESEECWRPLVGLTVNTNKNNVLHPPPPPDSRLPALGPLHSDGSATSNSAVPSFVP